MFFPKLNYSFLVLFFLIGCSVEKAIIPSYIYVDRFKLLTNSSTQGDTSQDVQDVWLFQNGEFKGSFGLPTYIPVTEQNKQNLVLRGGIKRSGQDDQRLQYPFYTDFDTILPFANLRSDTLKPVVKYLDFAKFPIIQDYDGAIDFFSIERAKPGDSVIKVNNAEAWKLNSNSAKFVLSDSTYELYYLSKELQNLPANGIPIYLEVDYKCNDIFDIGLSVISASETKRYSVYSANSTNGLWKKVYVDMSTEISSEIATKGTNTIFQILVRIKKSGTPLTDNTNLFLDNIKLIHF
jgi:predicted small secreted protein